MMRAIFRRFFFHESPPQSTRDLSPRRAGGNRARSLRIESLEDRALLSVVSGEALESGEVAIGIADSPSTPPAEVLSSMSVAADAPASAVILSEVPTSYWTYGCGATAVGMLFGYYDRVGYDNMYTGPTNGGVAPLVNLGQASDPDNPIEGSCSLIATMNGFDGRTTPGHVDDYWIASGSGGPDPWEATGVEHVQEGCVADFIGTNQWKWDTDKDGTINANNDGVTRYYYATNGSKYYDPIQSEALLGPRVALCHGMRLFAESRGYFVAENYNQLTDNQNSNGFTFQEYMAEIDAGCPVIVHTYGHMMTGVGYDEATQTVYLHNTWGNTLASMTWGGSYSGAAMRMVTVIHLESPDPQYDWGDAPDPAYPTLALSGGASHQILPTGPFLGATADAEADGLASDDLDGSDDEDGVRFTTDLVAGGTAGVSLLASGDGLVSAWVDFNDDGDWDDPGEEILSDVPVTQGATAYTFQVPSDAVATEETYARFRISTAGGLSPVGAADDGEVEDYAVSISDQLGTIEGFHWLDEDSDGVYDPEEPGLAHVQMYLDANDNGVWDAGEQTTTTGSDGSYQFTDVAPGVQIVRQVAVAGMTLTSPGIDPGVYVGTAYISGTNTVEVTTIDPVTGQVTRSGVTLNVKLYAMVTTNDGRIFGISSYTDCFYEVDPATMQLELVGATGYQLHQGMAYDPQTDTIYGVGTDGNSNRKYLLVFDRETGLPVPLDDGSSIVSGVASAAWDETNQRVLVFYNGSDQFFAYDTAGRATYLSTTSVAIEGRSLAWNGTSAVMQAFNANGNLSLLFFDPETGAENASRLTLSESTAMESLQYLPGTSYGHRVYVEAGETESGLDFGTFCELDFGDAPSPYPTLLADDGAWHLATGPTLGALRDTEADGCPDALAAGDDANLGDDEDGIVALSDLAPGLRDASIDVQVSETSYLNAWIDFNADGDWADPGEQIAVDLPMTAGINQVMFDVPPSALPGGTYARFRLTSYDTGAALAPSGAADDGEVEDYCFTIDDAFYLYSESEGDDAIRVILGTIGGAFHEVNIGGTVTTYDPTLVREFYLDGAEGCDHITIIGTGQNESVVLTPGSADVIGPDYEFHATNVEHITVDARAGSDEVELTGSAGSNRLFSYADSTRLSDIPRTFSYQVNNFETVSVDSSAGTNDYAFLYDSAENDILTATPDGVELNREDGTTTRTATGFEKVYAYATAGGSDTASLTGADGARNRLYSYADYTTLTESGRSFYFYARAFDSVSADSPGSSVSYAYLYDSAGDDTLEATPDSATMDRGALYSDVTATGFARVYAYATRGGDDSAALTGSTTGGNRYRGYPTYSTLTDASRSFYHYARGFDSVAATGSQSDSSGDRAWLYDSSGDDTLAAAVLENGKYQGATLSSNTGTYENQILYFDLVYARSSDRNTNDVIDLDEELLAFDLLESGTW